MPDGEKIASLYLDMRYGYRTICSHPMWVELRERSKNSN